MDRGRRGPRPNAYNGLCLECGRDLVGKPARRYTRGLIGVKCDVPQATGRVEVVAREWSFRSGEVQPHD